MQQALQVKKVVFAVLLSFAVLSTILLFRSHIKVFQLRCTKIQFVSNVSVDYKIQSLQTKILALYGGGRLGNHMFRIASGMGLAARSGRTLISTSKVISDKRIFPNNKFAFSNKDVLRKKYNGKITTIKEHLDDAMFYDDQLVETVSRDVSNAVILTGFYQSYKYFKHIEPEVKNFFSFSDALKNAAKSKLRSLKKTAETRVIGIHVRRGDMAGKNNVAYYPADLSYLKNATAFMDRKYGVNNTMYVVTSDDIVWCKKHLSYRHNVYFRDTKAQPWEDMCLLSHCDDIIITVGTFGWWSAYLNVHNGTVLYQCKMAVQNTLLHRITRHLNDHIPSSWIAM